MSKILLLHTLCQNNQVYFKLC